MIKKVNKALIGAFVVGAAVLLVISIVVFGSGSLFKTSDKYVIFFDGSVRGLSVGAPVVFRGVKIGNITSIGLAYAPERKKVLIPVVVDVELARVKGAPDPIGYPDYKSLINEGICARLEIQNFITSQLMIAFDFHPDKPKELYGLIKDYPELPALPISPDIFEVMNEIPVKSISVNLEQAVVGINRLVNSEGMSQLNETLQEVTQAARYMRLFIEYLEQHPEALLKGKQKPKGE